MPFILQHDLLIYKQARKFICNTHKLQPGVGITGSESLCLLFCYHSDLSLQAEVFLTLRYPQFLFLPDSHLYMLASVLKSLVSCSWAMLLYFNSLCTPVHLLVIQIEDFFKTLGVAVQLQTAHTLALFRLPNLFFQPCLLLLVHNLLASPVPSFSHCHAQTPYEKQSNKSQTY